MSMYWWHASNTSLCTRIRTWFCLVHFCQFHWKCRQHTLFNFTPYIFLIIHSIAEDQVIFPAVNSELSFVLEHAEEERRFNNFRRLIQQIQMAGAKSTAAEFYSELCSHADQIMEAIEKHFCNEETKVST